MVERSVGLSIFGELRRRLLAMSPPATMEPRAEEQPVAGTRGFWDLVGAGEQERRGDRLTLKDLEVWPPIDNAPM